MRMTIINENYNPNDLLEYWFSAEMKPHWFNSSTETDAELKDRYEKLWSMASVNVFDHWQEAAKGALALVILLDQIPLNIFRGQAKSFATERKALSVSSIAIDNKLDQQLLEAEKAFLYMPFMHSEDIDDQDDSVRLFDTLQNMPEAIQFAHHHRDIIQRFDRFPHRNKILDRVDTLDEIEYLESNEAFKG